MQERELSVDLDILEYRRDTDIVNYIIASHDINFFSLFRDSAVQIWPRAGITPVHEVLVVIIDDLVDLAVLETPMSRDLDAAACIATIDCKHHLSHVSLIVDDVHAEQSVWLWSVDKSFI